MFILTENSIFQFILTLQKLNKYIMASRENLKTHATLNASNETPTLRCGNFFRSRQLVLTIDIIF